MAVSQMSKFNSIMTPRATGVKELRLYEGVDNVILVHFKFELQLDAATVCSAAPAWRQILSCGPASLTNCDASWSALQRILL